MSQADAADTVRRLFKKYGINLGEVVLLMLWIMRPCSRRRI